MLYGCERLRRKSLHNAVWLAFADPDRGVVHEPDEALTYDVFLATIEAGLRIQRAQDV